MVCTVPGSSVCGISHQEYGGGLPFPSPGDRPNPGIKPLSSTWQVGSLPLNYLGGPKLACYVTIPFCYSFLIKK